MEMIQSTNRVMSRVKVDESRRYSEIHYHNEHELYFLLEGEVKYFVGDEIIQLHKGDFIFIPKGVLHKTDSETCLSLERLLVSFDDEVFDDEMQEIAEEFKREKLIRVPQSKLPLIEDIYCKIEKEIQKNKQFKASMIKAYIKQLLILLYRFKTNEKLKTNNKDRVINNVAEYISENFDKELDLKFLSKKFAFSQTHLSKKFKSEMGIGINEYINYVRVLNSSRYLKETSLSLTIISQKCGFNDSNYFSTVFKKFMGITPLKYRFISKTQNID